MPDLSVLIPSRHEQWLRRTIEDIVANRRADTEVIAVLDGEWAEPQIPDMPGVTLVHYVESIGQRAATNRAAQISTAKYVAKTDAHCAFDEGFDVKLLADMNDDWAVAPVMRNLWVFDWVCECGRRIYQSPTPSECTGCGNPRYKRNDEWTGSGTYWVCKCGKGLIQDSQPTECVGCNNPRYHRDLVWIPKRNPASTSYCFDPEPHFQYFGEFNDRPESKGDLTESMSLQGSFFMMRRDRYLKLNVCDEAFGSWGSQGIEVSVKSWLSGGKVMINHKTWYAHLFRTTGGDFGFPYHLSGKQVSRAKQKARDLFFNNKWEGQIHPLSWLVERFWPIPYWKDEDLARLKENDKKVSTPMKTNSAPIESNKLSKAIIYYTDNRLDPAIMSACQHQLKQSVNGSEIISVSLQPLDFGRNIVLDKERGYLTMFEQILTGLEASTADIAFFAEHDVLYAPGYLDFTPPDPNVIYYNLNVWQVRSTDGHMVYWDAKRTSQLCAYRKTLVEHYRKRVERVKRDGFSRRIGFEPASHHRPERIDDLQSDTWVAKYPNLDIKHGQNLTAARWSISEFRSQRNCRNWKESDEVPFWGTVANHFDEILEKIG